MASISNDKAIINELTNGSGDIHSLTAYMSYKEIPRETAIKDIKTFYHELRQKAKNIEFAINYGGNADTISRNMGIPIEEANGIYNGYMGGFKGLQRYQSFRRKDWWNKGYILLSPLIGYKYFIYNFKSLVTLKEKMNTPGFWDTYRSLKKTDPSNELVDSVRYFFKQKGDIERNSINYPIQAAGAFCSKLALIYFFDYLRKHNLIFKVKISIIPYDEVNCEAPSDIADEVAKVLKECMVKSGSYFCTKCKLDADTSYDEKGNLPSYWIH